MQPTNDAQVVLERLARLERHNVRLRLAMSVAIGIIALGVLAGAAIPVPKTIEAQGFTLVDPTGRHRAELGLLPEGGGVRLSLLDEKGVSRLQLNANNQDAGISLIESGELRASLNARTGKHVMLIIQKEKFDKMRNQMAFGYMDDGLPKIFINDAEAKTILLKP